MQHGVTIQLAVVLVLVLLAHTLRKFQIVIVLINASQLHGARILNELV